MMLGRRLKRVIVWASLGQATEKNTPRVDPGSKVARPRTEATARGWPSSQNPNGILVRTFWPDEFAICFWGPTHWKLILWYPLMHFSMGFWRQESFSDMFLETSPNFPCVFVRRSQSRSRRHRCALLQFGPCAPDEWKDVLKMWRNNRNSYSLQWKTSLTLGKMDEICHIRVRLENWVHQSDNRLWDFRWVETRDPSVVGGLPPTTRKASSSPKKKARSLFGCLVWALYRQFFLKLFTYFIFTDGSIHLH